MRMTTSLKQFHKALFYVFWDAIYAFFGFVFLVARIGSGVRWMFAAQTSPVQPLSHGLKRTSLNP